MELTNDAVRCYKQYLFDQAAKPKIVNQRLAALVAGTAIIRGW